MLRKVILFAAIATITVNVGLTVQAQSNNWSLEGRFVNYTLLSSPPKPALSPKSITFGANTSITMGAFGADFVGEVKNPLMLTVKIKNSTNSAQTFILPFPSDVIIHAESFFESAVAFYCWWGKLGWVTGGSGKIYIDVEQSGAVEFVYLIPRINGEITTKFGDVGSFKINAGGESVVPSPITGGKDPDLVIYYSYNEFGDVVPDESGRGNDGVINGSITPDPGGKRGGAAKFAKGSFIDLNGPKFPAIDIPVDAMTLCVWAKLEDTGEHHAIFNARATDRTWVVHPEFRSDGRLRWMLRAAGGTTIFDIQDGKWNAGEWSHFAGVYSAADALAILYLNGQKVAEKAGGAKIAGDWGLGARVGYNIDNARPFTGLMDDFVMYKRGLSQAEINMVMLGGPPEAASVSSRDNLTSTWGGIKAAK